MDRTRAGTGAEARLEEAGVDGPGLVGGAKDVEEGDPVGGPGEFDASAHAALGQDQPLCRQAADDLQGKGPRDVGVAREVLGAGPLAAAHAKRQHDPQAIIHPSREKHHRPPDRRLL